MVERCLGVAAGAGRSNNRRWLGGGLIHRLGGQRVSIPALGSAKQPALALLGDAGGGDIGAQHLGQHVMTGDNVMLAPFFVQAQLPAGDARAKILDFHFQRRGDAREALGQRRDQCPVAQFAQVSDGIASMSRRHSFPSSTGVLPVLTTCVGPRTAVAGLVGTTWPVMSQSNSIRTAASCCFTPGAPCSCCSCSIHAATSNGHEHQAAIFVPGEEPATGPRIGAARVRVADIGGEEFDVAPAGLVTGVGDERRHHGRPVFHNRGRGGFDDRGKLVGHGEGQLVLFRGHLVPLFYHGSRVDRGQVCDAVGCSIDS
jgi:hypothetical protein